ncbi:MAG: CBS domain-containing protein [Bacteroidota bacterium]
MLAKELIVEDLPALKPADTAELALSWMDEFKVTHLPVVHEGQLSGILSEDDLLDMDDPTSSVNCCNEQWANTSVFEDQHIFDVVKVVSDHNLTVIPVISNQQRYLGCTSINQLMKLIADMPVVSSPGGIIVLELNIIDYTLSEIARIVESNDAKILGSFITSHPDSTKMQVTLKINRMDLRPILKTFERFDYSVTASYDLSDYREDLKERYNLLMNYLNM